MVMSSITTAIKKLSAKETATLKEPKISITFIYITFLQPCVKN